jgi:hypothetical protein
MAVAAPLETVQTILNNGPMASQNLIRGHGFLALSGREAIIPKRLQRARAAAHIWPRATHYGLMIGSFPFVRMVAVTGALAMDNVEAGDDIDYLIVTRPGRLWLCRAIIIAFGVRPAARQGVVICPNFLLSERALAFPERDLFTAHELTQMVPVAGPSTYQRMLQVNSWTARFLPNAVDRRRAPGGESPDRGALGFLAESALRTPLGAVLEHWEMSRKVRRFSQQAQGHAGLAFGADWCKGHFDHHGQRILQAFSSRLREMGIPGVSYAA